MENFIVSARKYRPATFASVVGQKHITSTLKNAIERGQLAHAYLFCGPRGVGKTTCARIFAKAINCMNPVGAEACNECESCRTFNENRSLNIHELDAASNNSVDDIRNLIEQVRIIPQVGRYSVFIIDEVHMLSQQAFNAFLKTLEEPPAHAIFILATTEKHKIIPTILSRCQIYDFNRIRVEDGVEYLRYIASQEGVTADDESLNLIARKADGGMRDALSMFDKAVSFCGQRLEYRNVAQTLNVLDYDTYFKMTELLLAGNYVDALLLFDNVLSNGFSGQIFMAGLNQHLRDLLVAKGPAISLIEFTGTLLDRYKAQAANCDPGFLFGAISVLTDADGKIRQSSNQRLLVELGLMKIAALGQKKNEPIAFDEPILLPELPKGIPTPTATQPAVTTSTKTSVTTQTVTTSTATPTTETTPVAEQASAPTPPPVQVAASPIPTPMPASSPAVVTPKANPKPQTDAEDMASATPHAILSGASISSLLNNAYKATTSEDEEASQAEVSDIDPRTAEKLTAARAKIIDIINHERPRFIVAFESMSFDGHKIMLTVPSESLREEILLAATEILLKIAEVAGVTGKMEFDISVKEEVRKMRPIKLEDRMAHIEGKNPYYLELKKLLDLDVE
ncbi:MAG: DNA polymerase III subunit gamma/tau [Rikenellaceae bacterium]|nr:DNA polymerase III subunit gamma/tau [Rikenellaceae bacterium]